MWVEITVKLVEVNGGVVIFEFTATDVLEQVARAKRSRFIVGLEKTVQRLKAKRAKTARDAEAVRSERPYGLRCQDKFR